MLIDRLFFLTLSNQIWKWQQKMSVNIFPLSNMRQKSVKKSAQKIHEKNFADERMLRQKQFIAFHAENTAKERKRKKMEKMYWNSLAMSAMVTWKRFSLPRQFIARQDIWIIFSFNPCSFANILLPFSRFLRSPLRCGNGHRTFRIIIHKMHTRETWAYEFRS